MIKSSAFTFFFLLIFCFHNLSGQINPEFVKRAVEDSIERKKIDSLKERVILTYFEKNYGRTVEIGKNAIERAQRINYYQQLFVLNSYLGNAFLAIEDTLQAKRTFSETLALAQKIKDTSALIINSIDLGNVYLQEDNSKRAIELYEQTIPIAKKRLNNKDLTKAQKEALEINLFVLNYNIAEIYLDEKNVRKGRQFVRDTREFYTDSLYPAYKAAFNYNEGRLLALENKPQEALKKYALSDSLGRAIGFTDLLIDVAQTRIEEETKFKNYEGIVGLLKDVDSLKSEKYKTDRIVAVETATAKFKLDQYERDLKTQELQNEIDQQIAREETTKKWIIIALCILLAAASILLVSYVRRKKLLRNLKLKNKQYAAEKEKTEALSKAKTILFSNIAHELRTPAYGIVGISNAIEKPEEKENLQENIKTLQYSAKYLRSLINNILLFNKVDHMEDYDLDDFEFSIREVVKNAVESSKHLNQLAPSTYKIEINEAIPEKIRGDEVKLSQILMNLISNATKFTSGGVISISVLLNEKNDTNTSVTFIVKDTGKGIEKAIIPDLFNEFSDLSTLHTTKGYGLGLPIVKKLLDAHKAKIDISSKVNEGTVISFTLNYKTVAILPDSESKKINSEKTEAKPFTSKKFLVVDDNKINLLVTQKTISNLGGTAVLADSGMEAIKLANENDFDLIFMDINMPEMDGFKTSEEIRSFDKDIPIVALTAVDLHTISERNTEGLLDDFLIKPYRIEEFVSTVLKYLPIPIQ